MNDDWLDPRDPADYWKSGQERPVWKDNETLAKESLRRMQEMLDCVISLAPRDHLLRIRAKFAHEGGHAEYVARLDRELRLTDEERRAARQSWYPY